MTKLTTAAVHTITKRVLFKNDEIVSGKPPANALIVEGILRNYAFHPERVAAAKPEIDAMLAELPDQFYRAKGGGWSFLNACMDRHGNQWGEQPDMETLVCLGIAAGSATWLLKEMSTALPGGVPYFEIHPGEDRKAA